MTGGVTAVTAVVASDFSSTIENVRLMNGDDVLVEGAVVTFEDNSTSDVAEDDYTLITFKDDFIVEESLDTIEAVLVVDTNTVTTEGGETSATLGDISVELVAIPSTDVLGESSNDDITATGTTVASTAISIVPVTVLASVTDEFGTDDQEAKIEFTVNEGSNDLEDDTVSIVSITFESADDMNAISTISNDDNSDIAFSTGGTTITFTTAEEINNGDVFTFSNTTANEIVKISANGISYEVESTSYTITNDKVLDLKNYAE